MLDKITAEGIAVLGLVIIALAALFQSPEPEIIVVAVAAGLVGFIKGTIKT